MNVHMLVAVHETRAAALAGLAADAAAEAAEAA
jgi:hypothetical protein